ncbi:MAG: DnaJ domain-containing protein [Rhodospirillales bacterium]|nr:DnaJ domain-containing protein [Rhodospirillales bacterium]
MANTSKAIELDHFGPQDADARCCDWPGCRVEGYHRAPKSRKELENYHWFCMGHAREYNAGWNYYVGMSDDEVEADVRRDTVWHRPSWPLAGGQPSNGKFQFTPEDVMDQMGAFGPEWSQNGGYGKQPSQNAKAGTREAWAVAVFALTGPVNEEAVKARYKELVKQHHPDANGGDKGSEEKIKEINEAYQIIMKMLTA